jgi:hypothetical protein
MRILGVVLLLVGGGFVFGSGTTWVQLVGCAPVTSRRWRQSSGA